MNTKEYIAAAAVQARPRLKSLAISYCARSNCISEVEDLVDEAILSAISSSHTFKGGNIEAWLVTILKNEWRTFLRRRRRRRESLLPLSDASEVCNSEESVSARIDIIQALDLVPNIGFRQCLELSLLGYNVNEISNMLHIPEGTVKSRTARAREYATGRHVYARN